MMIEMGGDKIVNSLLTAWHGWVDDIFFFFSMKHFKSMTFSLISSLREIIYGTLQLSFTLMESKMDFHS